MMMYRSLQRYDIFLAIVCFLAIHWLCCLYKSLIRTGDEGCANFVKADHFSEGWKKNGFTQ